VIIFPFQFRSHCRFSFNHVEIMNTELFLDYEFVIDSDPLAVSYMKFNFLEGKISFFNFGFYLEEPDDHDAIFSTYNSDLMIFTDAFNQMKTKWKVELLMEDSNIPKQIILHSDNGEKVVLYLRENQMSD